MGFVILIVVVFLAGWYFGARDKGASNESDLAKRNLEWSKFIASYKKVVKTKEEKGLIKRMLGDIRSSGLPTVADIDLPELEFEATKSQALEVSNTQLVGNTEEVPTIDKTSFITPDFIEKDAEDSTGSDINLPNFDIDGPSLLLYFGAFLFIASAGLFVAFGQISGFLKTIIVLVIVASLYILGLWLYKQQPKFSQVGLAFAGISLAIAPLVGLAAYKYIFNESSGDLVWLITSLFCLVFYLHALVNLKKPLINYIFIFTFLSLFESSISIIDAPIYYFGWGLAIVGIITMLAAKLKVIDESFKEASGNTSAFFIPLSVIVSLAMIQSEGLTQLSISLLLAAVFYFLQFLMEKDTSRFNYLTISHVSFLSSVGTFAYALNNSFKDVAIALLITNSVQFIVALVYKLPDLYKYNYLNVLVGSSALAVLFSWLYPSILIVNLVALIVICLALWFRYKDDVLYGLGFIAIPAVPIYISYFALGTTPDYTQVAYYLLVSMLVMQGFYALTQKNINLELENFAKYSFWLVGLAVMILAFAGDNTLSMLALIYATVFINLIFGLYLKSKDFSIAASLLILIASLSAMILTIANHSIITINIFVFIFLNFYIWLKYVESNAFNLAFITIPLAPIYISYFLIEPQLKATQAAFNIVVALLMLYLVYFMARKRLNEQNIFLAKSTILVTSFITILIGFSGDSATGIMLISYIVLLLSVLFGVFYKDRDFILASGVIASIPILRFIGGGQELFYSSAVALSFNIYSALKYREELFRWLGSIIWFSLPAVLNTAFILGWGVNEFCVSYIVVSLGFILARSIARGSVFASSKIPLISYDRNKSLSYVFGNVAALLLAVMLSLTSEEAQLLSSITFGYILIVIVLSAKFIEKNQYLYSLVPIFLQVLILTAIRPDNVNGLLDFYAISSITAASAMYFAANVASIKKDAKNWVVGMSLISTYTVTFISLGGEYSWMAPFTLLVAGFITVYHFWNNGQQSRELSGAIIGAAIMWILYYFGIREVQAYTHVIALQLAIYAYFRYKLDQKNIAESYVISALAIATIPLVIQATSGESGGLFGWWLLLEQIIFMLIGISIKNKILTFWGLYVAIGAVLYQLRNLGWAALTLLAVVIIAIAVYKIAKNNDNED